MERIVLGIIVVFGLLVLFIILGDPTPRSTGRAHFSRAKRYLHRANSITAKEE